MIRSTLSTLVNTTIGRVRRRTSTKQRSITLAGGRALIPKNDFGWPILAGLFLARVMGSFSCPFASFHLAAPGCRLGTRGGNLHSRILSALRPGNFQLFADGPHSSFLDFTMAGDAGDLVQRRVEPNAMGSTLAIQSATVLAQMASQFREFHASAISITSRTACGERPFSASSRWHCNASFSASARFALASSMVSPCEIAAGISSTKQVEPAEKIVFWLLSFLRVAFDATRNQVAVGIAPLPYPRHDVVQALDRRRRPAHTVEALAALARVDGLSQRRVLQKVCLLDVNRRAGARPIFLDGDSGPVLDAIQLLSANLLGQPHLDHVPRLAPLDQAHSALGHESAHRLAHRPRG